MSVNCGVAVGIDTLLYPDTLLAFYSFTPLTFYSLAYFSLYLHFILVRFHRYTKVTDFCIFLGAGRCVWMAVMALIVYAFMDW
jgi:hypothetical protein